MSRNLRQTHNQNLKDPEVAAEYLNEAFREGVPAVAPPSHTIEKLLSTSMCLITPTRSDTTNFCWFETAHINVRLNYIDVTVLIIIKPNI